MRYVAFDIETHLIKKVGDVTTLLTPRPVCLTWATPGTARLLDRAGGYFWLRDQLRDPDVTLVGANVVYDLGCYCAEYPDLLPLVFIAYGAGRIRDVQLRQALIDIAHGELKFRTQGGKLVRSLRSLAALADYWLDIKLAKEGTYRLRYGELDGVALTDWPEEAKSYALSDATTTLDVWLMQDQHINEVTQIWAQRKIPPLADEAHQNRATWALHLMSVWGVRTDPKVVGELDSVIVSEYVATQKVLFEAGIVREDGSKDTKALRARIEAGWRTLGEDPPRSDPSSRFPQGQISISGDDLEALEQRTVEIGMQVDDVLKALAASASNESIRTHWLPALKVGTTWPVCAWYRSPMETGRTSCSAPNMQNPPKKGGVRECFIPRGPTYEEIEVPDSYQLQPGEEWVDEE